MTGKVSRRHFIASAAAASSLAAPAIVTAQPKVKWRAQAMWSAAETTYKAFEDFCQRVGAASGGRLEIQPFAAGSVVGVFETLDAVSAGVLDAQSTAPVYWAGKDAGFSMIGDLNFAYQHPWQAEAWYYHRGGLEMLREAYAKFNVYPVGVSWWGVEALVSKKPLNSVEDFKGMKIRTPQGMFAEIMTKLGASVVVVPGGEVYSALDKGVVDAADWATESMNFRMGFFEVAKTSVRIGHSMPSQEFAVNKAKWDALAAGSQGDRVELRAGVDLGPGPADRGRGHPCHRGHPQQGRHRRVDARRGNRQDAQSCGEDLGRVVQEDTTGQEGL